MGFVPIEQIKPGDRVYAHDGQPHRVRRILVRHHAGTMIGIRREGCDEVLWVTGDHLVLSNRRVQAVSEHGQWQDIPGEHFGHARRMPREMSPPERKLWQRLRGEQLGVKFRRQHPIGPYIADFYSRGTAMVVEVDGEQHFDGGPAEASDRRRDAYMEAMGLRVLRFPANRVGNDMESVLTEIEYYARERVLEEDKEKQWRYAGELRVGDVVYEVTPLDPPASGGNVVGPTVSGGERTPLCPPASGGREDSLPACGESWGGVSTALRPCEQRSSEPSFSEPHSSEPRSSGLRPCELRPCRIVGIERQQTREEVYDLEIENVHSFLTNVCAVHNCGSGTTAYVAEQWGRRWITCDTSRVARRPSSV